MKVIINKDVLKALEGLEAVCDVGKKAVILQIGFFKDGYAQESYLWKVLVDNEVAPNAKR